MASFTIDHVALLFCKLREVQYEAKHVGINLGLKNGDIEAVCKQSHKPPHECLQDVFTLWLKLLPKQRTWKILVEALRSGGEHVIADKIENDYTLDQSVSVPLHDVLSLVEGINTTHWRSLGLILGLPLSQINEIDDKGGWSEYVMIELLSLWVRGNGNKPATLDTLVTAVKKLPNIGLAERLLADRELHFSSCLDLTPVAPIEQNIQGRSLKSDGTLELEAVIQQSSNDSDMDSVLESTVITASNNEDNVILQSQSNNLTSLLQKYSLSQADVEKPCDDNLFLILESKISNFDDTAPYFGFNQPEVDIQIEEQSKELSMLWEWRNRNGSDATYLAIMKIFLDTKEQNLAEIVLQHFKQCQPKPIKSFVYPEEVSEHGNWDEKSPAEREHIKNRLFNENEIIREKFAFLTRRILRSFKSSNVDVTELKLFLYSFGVSDNIPAPAHGTLLPNFEGTTNLDSLFLILCRYYSSWLNIQLLKVIIKGFGTEEDKKDMKAYEDDLADYLKRSIYEIPSKSYAPGYKNADLIFLYLLLPNNVLPTGKDVEDITRNMSQLLGISDGILQFISFKNCSILLKFGVPKQLLHINTLRNVIEMYFNAEKKGYTFNGDLSLLLPLRKYDDSALIRSKIEPTESIVIRDVPLTSLSNISELSNMDDILTSALKEGGGKLKTCNVVLHGPPGVGKSSLKRLILGYPPLQREQQNATGIIENAVRAVSTTRLAGGRQTLAEVNNVELIKMLAKQVKFLHLSSDIPQDDSTHQHIPETHKKIPFQPFVTIKNFLFKRKSKSSLLPGTSSSAAMTSIREQLAENVEPSNEIYDDNWIHLIDSGGCPQFLDVFPLLYCNESFHIVVTRLDEGLDDKPNVCFYKEGNDVYVLPDRLMLSNREFIERACQMAEAQATSRKFVPKVMVIGTYKHKLGIDGEARLKEINKELTKIHQKYSRVLICKSKDEVIFAVNALAPVGEERQLYTEELQECILKAAQDTSYEIYVPLKWFAFYLDLNKTGGVVRKSECYKTGEILGMKKTDVEEALKYFNRVGLLLHYPDDFPDLVFTKIDQLTSRISGLITASFITPGSSVTAPYDRLRQKGLFNKLFLPTIFEDLDNSEKDFHDDDFLQLLECLKIAVHVGDADYFLPSALSLDPPVDDSPFPMSCVPLVYSWDEQILPHGFFLTFVVELLQQQESGDKLYFELREDVIQCRYVIQVTVAKKKIPGCLKLVDRKRWIEICYSCSHISTKYCSQLREITSDRVERAVKRFEHTGIKSPEIGFRCSLCDTNDHYCIPSHDYSMVSCSRSTGSVTPHMSCWLERHGSEGSSQYSVSHINLAKGNSPFDIFKRYMSEMLGVISNTERLATDLFSVDLVPYPVKDDVITTSLSRYQKASKILNEIERSLRDFNKPETLRSYCEVLKQQKNSALKRIADDILKELGSSQYSVSDSTLTTGINTHVTSSSHTTSFSQITTDYSPSDIFKRHMSEMLRVISDTERLANDLSSADLIPYSVKDEVITTNLSRYQIASILLNEIERSLRVFNKPEILISYCEVLKKQTNPCQKIIAENMLKELDFTGSSQYSVSHIHLAKDYSPFEIFKRHMSEMLGVISDTEKLANDLFSIHLISYRIKDDVIISKFSHYQKASKLLNEVERSLRVFNKPETLISYCEVLRKQKNRPLAKIAQKMLEQLGSSQYSVSDRTLIADHSPSNIFKRHMSEMLGIISDTEKLANDLSSADLISHEVKDEVITTNHSRYQNASKLVNEIERLLGVFNEPDILILCCEVLKKQENPALRRKAEDLLKKLGSSQYSVSHVNLAKDYSPFDIFKRHKVEIVGMISDTERLANDLSSVDLISYQVKDEVITTTLSRYERASILLNEIERSLRVFNEPEILISCCEVLKKQENPALTVIAEDMLTELD